MDITELNKVLREKAVEHGLCDDWQKNIWNRDLSYQELLMIFIRGFDFSVNKDWIDYGFIKEVFPEEELHKGNVYIDEKVVINEASNGYYVFLGNCEAEVYIDGFKAVTVYVRHQSKVNVNASGGAKVFVTYYDQSKGKCMSDGWSACKRYDRRKKEG